ncbi:hypothetical protein D9758_006649 [Tetrapyrgos nigripes]|uniref:Uncharacterized protein n=1 Tax=Tetrapyrgos nigripes TaxID=182062 RepID=A0A8H5GJK5_9AGAR|nr:hypothetical protein D9758_006649 [Tetrapyrgos nigripes]
MDVDMNNSSTAHATFDLSTAPKPGLYGNLTPASFSSPIRAPSFAFGPTTLTKPGAGKIRIPSLEERQKIATMREVFGEDDEGYDVSNWYELGYDEEDLRYFEPVKASEQETNQYLNSLGWPPQRPVMKRKIAGSRRLLSAQTNSKDPRIRAQAFNDLAKLSVSTPSTPSRDRVCQAQPGFNSPQGGRGNNDWPGVSRTVSYGNGSTYDGGATLPPPFQAQYQLVPCDSEDVEMGDA